MITRLMISLKKASLSTGSTEWSLGASTVQQSDLSMQFNRYDPYALEEEPILDGEIPLSPVPKLDEKGDC